MKFIRTCLLLAAPFAFGAPVPPPVTSIAELNRLAESEPSELRSFEFRATVITLFDRERHIPFLVTDGTGYTPLSITDTPGGLAPGDRIRVVGNVIRTSDGNRYRHVHHMDILSHGKPPEPVDATAEDIYAGRMTYAYIRVTGRVVDAFHDEADPRFAFLVLSIGPDTIHLSSRAFSDELLATLIDAKITATGLCFKYAPSSPRAQLGYGISVFGQERISVIEPAPADPFDVPVLDGLAHDVWRPQADAPRRRRLSGRVIAVWSGNRMLLRLMSRKTAFVETIGTETPRIGDSVDAVGLPETDFYHLNLSHAVWRRREPLPISEDPVEPVDAASLLTDAAGHPTYQVAYNGRAVRLAGFVRTFARRGNDENTVQLECNGFQITLDASAAPAALAALEPGARIAATGVCIMETDNWRLQAPFPHVHGLRIVLRSPDDVTVLDNPPWWTRERFLVLIAALLAALAAILAWNAMLRRLVLRKGRELMKEQLRGERARLKTRERTRLAIELHDSLSQTLTGIALEMKAAQTATDLADPKARVHLDIAERSLASCHTELRNCLWDLRNNALESTDLDEAIRRTLRPQIGDIDLAVRCRVPRRILTDETAHAVLKILRELAANAANHGHATRIAVAGVRDGGILRFSVRDNGRGFDPATAPGPRQGHFGLLGVTERLNDFGGGMAIERLPGAGIRIVLSLRLPEAPNREEGADA